MIINTHKNYIIRKEIERRPTAKPETEEGDRRWDGGRAGKGTGGARVFGGVDWIRTKVGGG